MIRVWADQPGEDLENDVRYLLHLYEDDGETLNTMTIVTSWGDDLSQGGDGPVVWERYDFDRSGNFTFVDTEYKIYAPEEEYNDGLMNDDDEPYRDQQAIETGKAAREINISMLDLIQAVTNASIEDFEELATTMKGCERILEIIRSGGITVEEFRKRVAEMNNSAGTLESMEEDK